VVGSRTVNCVRIPQPLDPSWLAFLTIASKLLQSYAVQLDSTQGDPSSPTWE
jgi:hypothetical protein